MAATLSANYGIYGPAYELLEHKPLREGGEEYLDSEKFERKVWDRVAAGLAGRLHRRGQPCPPRATRRCRNDTGLRFLPIDNEALIAYAKQSSRRLRTSSSASSTSTRYHMHSGWVELDLEALGVEPQQAVPDARPDHRRALPVARPAQLRAARSATAARRT